MAAPPYIAVPVYDGGPLLGVVRVSAPTEAVTPDRRALAAGVVAALVATALGVVAGLRDRACGDLAVGPAAPGGPRPRSGSLRPAGDAGRPGAGEVAELASRLQRHGRAAANDRELARRGALTALAALLASTEDALVALDAAGVVRQPGGRAPLRPCRGAALR
ncbi:MAG: hypothetical protein U0531_04145 [Dehalococcoidia bacterium]